MLYKKRSPKKYIYVDLLGDLLLNPRKIGFIPTSDKHPKLLGASY